ncbi:MAG: pyridoxine 5'-phosphate synthase [Hyphomicrobiales bacterium]|nr:MAG: pyridoxine 5'-phosphate synthase [Hyphomicrobiales bacterium]
MENKTILSVNLNAIAMLRNRRDMPWPSLIDLGRIALEAGAGGLTVHPRPDQRHIRFSDVPEIRALLDDDAPQAEYNIEGYPTDEFLDLAEVNQPEQVTLVPDDPSQATSDHGWEFINQGNYLRPIVARLKNAGFRVAMFCDPDASEDEVRAAADIGADRLELFTGPYGASYDNDEVCSKCLDDLERTAGFAQKHGLELNAGHDLTVDNLPALMRRVPGILEVSIGHGLTADALQYGMAGAVQRFLTALGH